MGVVRPFIQDAAYLLLVDLRDKSAYHHCNIRTAQHYSWHMAAPVDVAALPPLGQFTFAVLYDAHGDSTGARAARAGAAERVQVLLQLWPGWCGESARAGRRFAMRHCA